MDSTASSKLGIDEPSRQGAVSKGVTPSHIQAFTGDNTSGPIYTFYKNNAFYGASYLWGYHSIEEIVVHEAIHAAGVPPTPGRFGGHDLKGYSHYQNILDKCQIDL